MTHDDQHKQDMQWLLQQGQFKRFLWRVIQSAGILAVQTDGSVGRNLDYIEGRRNLGLELLAMAEDGQPVPEVHPAGSLLTLIQVLREETSQPTEKPNGRTKRTDRYTELSPGGDADE